MKIANQHWRGVGWLPDVNVKWVVSTVIMCYVFRFLVFFKL